MHFNSSLQWCTGTLHNAIWGFEDLLVAVTVEIKTLGGLFVYIPGRGQVDRLDIIITGEYYSIGQRDTGNERKNKYDKWKWQTKRDWNIGIEIAENPNV